MPEIRLKRSLFGYTRESVFAYIDEIKHETEKNNSKFLQYQEEIENLKKKQEELIETISEKEKVNERLECELKEIKEEKADDQETQSDVVDVLIEAKKFANNLNRKAEIEYKLRKSEAERKLKAEKERVDKYIEAVDILRQEINEICKVFEANIESKKKDLENIDTDPDIKLHLMVK